jgi:zinc protease
LTGSRIAISITLAATLAALCLNASTPAGAQAAKQPAPKTAANQVFQFALQNGMQVLVIPDHRAPVVTQMLWFKVGGVDDPPGVSGLAHFFEHMMFRGTKQTPGDEYSQIIAKNGGDENAFTTHDFTAFYEQIAADRLKLVMDLEADRMVNLDLSDNSVSTERDVVLEERRMRVDNNPQAMLGEQMEAALHLSHPYGRPVIGWAEEVRRLDRAAAQDFYDHHYAPNNAILIVAGDVTPDQIKSLAQSEYGKVAAREIPPRAEFAEPPRMAETRMTVQRPDTPVPVFTRTYRVPSYAQAAPGQAESFELLSQVMGGGQTSTLYRILVEQKKLASEAGANYEGNVRDAAEFSVYAVPRPGVSLDVLEKAVDQVIQSFTAAPANAADLNRAKTQLVASVTYRRDSQMAMANAYGTALMIGLTVDDVNAWPTRIKAVDGEAVRHAAQGLNRRDAVTAYLLPSGAPKP